LIELPLQVITQTWQSVPLATTP